ncbi:MAG TPA: divalent-cation tolerance protein CutA [Nitrosopumilaceae archaeon]|nr:divalent-cation tolerance protein CutA [Nitrosopumilaceae archaeon]
MNPVIIISTYPNKKSLDKISNQIVKDKLAACVNISKISSVYSWKGKIENESEYMAFFKTSQKNKRKLKQKIKETHPYDVPEIAEIPVKSINQPYLKWIINSTL